MAARLLEHGALLLERPVPVERSRDSPKATCRCRTPRRSWTPIAGRAGPGMRVLDACAAPGGKTAHMLERADIDLLALDTEPTRLERVQVEPRRLRLQLARSCSCGDARETGAMVGRRALQRDPRRRAVLRIGRGAAPSRHQVAATPGDIARFARNKQREILDALWQTARRWW